MATVRIMVDGYSLLHKWPAMAPGRPRHSAQAREALVQVLAQYQDAVGTPVSVIFDGGGAPSGTPKNETANGPEVLFSEKGQTADQIIERVAHLMKPYGEILAVTDDRLERDTVIGLGGTAASCANFIQMVETSLSELQTDIHAHNRRERKDFNRPAL